MRTEYTPMEIEFAARIAHEVNRAYCESIGDNTIMPWAEAPDWQRASALAGVDFHIHNPDATPSASHDNWLRHKEQDGWQWGPNKDPDAKRHPCMLPFNELPVTQRTKDYLFRAVVHAILSMDVKREHSPV